MIERGLFAKGKRIKFGQNYFAPGRVMELSWDHVRHANFRVQQTRPTTLLGDTSRTLFQWLGYVPGKITQVPLGNLDVLSGAFTGCWMTVYRMGGREYVGHIGTEDNPNSANSVQVKQAWNAFAGGMGINPGAIMGFQPHRVLALRAFQFSHPFKVLGLVTPNKNFYSIVIETEGAEIWRVVEVMHMTSRPAANVFHMPAAA